MMSVKIAHINEQGQDMIIIPVAGEFGRRATEDRRAALEAMRHAVREHGLAGTVVPVWPAEDDEDMERFHFMAPRPWHGFLRNRNWQWIAANLNRTIAV